VCLPSKGVLERPLPDQRGIGNQLFAHLSENIP
jgi:hypothetical protein